MTRRVWLDTPEYAAIQSEIKRHPVGTKPVDIFKHMLPETWDLLEKAGRTQGKTKGWSVYRFICKELRSSRS